MTAHAARAQSPIDFPAFGKAVGEACRARGMSFRGLAALVAVSPSTVTRIAQGRVCDASAYALLCLWLGVSLDSYVRQPTGVGPERARRGAAGTEGPEWHMETPKAVQRPYGAGRRI